MQVLHVIPSIAEAHGGPSEAVALMAEGLAARGFGVTIATTDDAGPGRRLDRREQDERRSRFAAHGVDLAMAAKGTELYKVSLPLAGWLWCNVRRFDVVHVHALFSFASVAAAQISRARDVPYIIRPLGVLGRYGMSQRRPLLKRLSFSLLEGPVLRGAAAVHFTSESERDEALRVASPVRATIIPLAARDPGPIDPAGLLAELGATTTRSRILFLSRLDPKKNLEGLLRALALLKNRANPLPYLLVAGDGDPGYIADLRRLAEELGLRDSVAWLGAVAGERKAMAWAAADMFVLPSHSENFGIAAAEAMLCALPCLLGEGVALASAAAADGAVRLTSTDPEAIADQIAALLADPGGAKALGAKARDFAVRTYSIEAMSENLHHLYSDLAPSR